MSVLWIVIILCTMLLCLSLLYRRRHLKRRWGMIVISGLLSGLGAAVISMIRHTYADLQRNVLLFGAELILSISAVILLLIFTIVTRGWKNLGSSDENIRDR